MKTIMDRLIIGAPTISKRDLKTKKIDQPKEKIAVTASTMYIRGLLNNLAKMDGFVMISGSMCRYLSMAINMIIDVDNINTIEFNMLAAKTKEE